MKKGLLAVLLCVIMVMALLPATAFAAEDGPTKVWIGGMELTAENSYYHNSSGTEPFGWVDDASSSYNASYDPATNTLKLNGISIASGNKGYDNKRCSLYADGDLTILLETNDERIGVSCTVDSGSEPYCYAIYVDGDLTVKHAPDVSGGSLEVMLENEHNVYEDGSAESVGIYAKGKLTVQGGVTVKATINSSTKAQNALCAGVMANEIYVEDATLTSEFGEEAIAEGENGGGASYGLFAAETFYADNSTVTGKSSTATGYQSESCGIAAGQFTSVNGSVIHGETQDYSSYVTQTCTGIRVQRGAGTNGTMTVSSGSEITATARKATLSSQGIAVQGDINMEGGRITAIGGDAGSVDADDGVKSIGISADNNIIVSAGEVTATGGDVIHEGEGYPFSAGFRAREITVSGGTVSANGGATPNGLNHTSCGIFCFGTNGLTVSGGTLTAVGNISAGESYGVNSISDIGIIKVTGGKLTAKASENARIASKALSKVLTLGPGVGAKGSTSSDGTSSVDYVGANNGNYKWVETTLLPVLSVAATPSGSVVKDTVVTLRATPINIDNPTYKWYSNTIISTEGANEITGANTDTYAPPTNTAGTVYYYCLAEKETGSGAISVTSNIVTVTVNQPTGGDYTPSPVTVYNDPSVPDATVWLTGSGLGSSDLLVTERDPKGSAYKALLKLANSDDVFATYNIYLRSGKKSTGFAMNLTFDLNAKYAGNDFTLVHQKADSTYEYFYDTADANGDLTFGPLYELSPFMLVKGTLTPASMANVVDIPKTGDNTQPGLWAGIAFLACAGLAASLVLARRKRQNG